MDASELIQRVTSAAERISEIAPQSRLFGLGYAIEIPRHASSAARDAAQSQLTTRGWNFERVMIRGLEYFVLFPL